MSISSEHIDGRCIDQLVAGELPEDERRELLLHLDSQPDGWRQCALAFLEAQMWREALAPLGTTAGADRIAAATVIHAPEPRLWRRFAHWSALASCIAAAFVLGWAVKQVPQPAALSQPDRVVAAVQPSDAEAPQPNTAVVSVEQAKPTQRGESNPLFESMVASYERRGYASERQKKAVKVKLEDGTERQVKAEEVRLRFVGDRTY
jgi:hypothetical protein